MSLITSPQVSDLAIELLKRQSVLPATVSRVAASEYTGTGGKVTARVPVPREAGEQETPGEQIDFSLIEETDVDVVLKHFYDAQHVHDEHLSLSVVDFARQIVAPAVASVADACESEIATALSTVVPEVELVFDPDGEDPDADLDVLLEIREQLNARKVPMPGRTLAVGGTVARRLLLHPRISEQAARGEAGTTALAEATLGRLYGFDIVESQHLPADRAVGYHRSACAVASRAPMVPTQSGAQGRSIAQDGYAMRLIRAFVPSHLTTAVIVSSFIGAAMVEDAEQIERAIAVEIDGS